MSDIMFNLDRIRVDIGNVEGSLSDLLKFKDFRGLNDNYEPQEKPRLVGTWTINNWYTTEQLAEARAAFDGLTIVEDPNYVIDFNDLAVQTIDNTKPNYNPAVAIRFNQIGYGHVLQAPVVEGQKGRYILTKAEAATISSFPENFVSTSPLSDENKIVSDTVQEYPTEDFIYWKYFTSATHCYTNSFNGGAFQSGIVEIPSFVEYYGNSNGDYTGFWACFYTGNTGGTHAIRMLRLTPGVFYTRNYEYLLGGRGLRKIYLGIGNKYIDNLTLETYLNDSDWALLGNIYQTWYSYAAPQLSYDGTNVTITVERDSTIYYTTDGTTPTINSTEYTEPFAWDGTGVIKAMAIETIDNVDDIAYADDFYAQTTANPTITISNGEIVLASTTPNAIIYYTTDGTYPTKQSAVYTSPLNYGTYCINKIRCFATALDNNDSELTELDISTTIALQTMNSSAVGYNPAVAIKLEQAGKGSYVDVNDKTQGWYLTKDAAALITSLPSFENVVSITDTNGICGTVASSYNFTSFNELVFFTEITQLPNSCFSGCSKLETIIFPNSIITLGNNYVCRNCTSLKNIKITSNVGTGATSMHFIGCTSLENVTFDGGSFTDRANSDVWSFRNTNPNGFTVEYKNSTSTGDYCLGRSYVNNIIFDGSINSIGNEFCADASLLTEVDIPSSVTYIRGNAFNGSYITTIICRATTPPQLTTGSNKPNLAHIYVPAASVSAYQSAANWSAYASIISAIPTT